ncbi:MAG: response regulator transcription factor [Lentisphaeraceae bacterium]|nr:response regulator transcription factor [Lentisphaeraceae bacterium]
MKILLVEDQTKIASFIVKGLKEQFYTVDHAVDGEQAKALSSLHTYDLILLDLMLPGMSGNELCREWRQQGLQTSILVLSAKSNTQEKIDLLDLGANDYLCKPFDFGELLARIRVQTRAKEESEMTMLVAADLSMDLVTREVGRGGQNIELTAKEFSLLEYLLRNKGRVVSRTSIIENVWDMHFDSDTNVVDVFIRYLRKKIDEDFELKLIQTCRGRGYKIDL